MMTTQPSKPLPCQPLVQHLNQWKAEGKKRDELLALIGRFILSILSTERKLSMYLPTSLT